MPQINVTFLQGRSFGIAYIPAGTTGDMDEDQARGLGSGFVKINGPATGTPILGAVSGGGNSTSKRSGRSAFQARVTTGARASANSSFALALSQPGGFKAFRIIARNYDSAAVMNVTARAAASPTATPTGSGLTPVNVTWGRDPGTGALLTSKAIPAAETVPIGSQKSQGVAVSDWIQLDSVARTDVVGADPVLYLRITSPEGMWYDPVDWNQPQPIATGRVLRTAFQSGSDTVTGWSNMTLAAASSCILPDVQIEFLSNGNTRNASIVVFADSLAAGGPSPVINYILAAQEKMKTAGVVAGIGMYAVGGQRRQTTSQNLQKIVALQKPDIVILHDYSVNSASAPAITSAEQFTYLLSDIDAIKAAGAKPVIVTMHTNNTYAQRTRDAFTGLYDIVDMAALLSDGGSGIQDQYCADPVSDRTHISALGADVVGTRLAAVLAALIPAAT